MPAEMSISTVANNTTKYRTSANEFDITEYIKSNAGHFVNADRVFIKELSIDDPLYKFGSGKREINATLTYSPVKDSFYGNLEAAGEEQTESLRFTMESGIGFFRFYKTYTINRESTDQ